MRRVKSLHLFWKRITLFNMFIRNVHVSLCSINLYLENGPGKKCIWKRICKINQIRRINYKHKYKYMVWNLIKYKYKYKYAVKWHVISLLKGTETVPQVVPENSEGTRATVLSRLIPGCHLQHSNRKVSVPLSFGRAWRISWRQTWTVLDFQKIKLHLVWKEITPTNIVQLK